MMVRQLPVVPVGNVVRATSVTSIVQVVCLTLSSEYFSCAMMVRQLPVVPVGNVVRATSVTNIVQVMYEVVLLVVFFNN